MPDVEDHPALGRAAEQLLTEQSAVLKSTGFSKYQLHTSDVPVVVTLMSIVVLSGIMRFHMNACREEQGGGHLHGACAHPVLNVFSGRMGLWMQNAHTAKVLQMVAMTLPTWSCAGLALRYSSCCLSTGRWSIQRILLYQGVALATGVLAGLVGVGGGLVLSPFFLITGMEPAMAVGTSATCVLFTSCSTTIQYVFTDRIIMSLAVVYGFVALAASYVGTSLVHIIHLRFAGRRSYISMIVALGVALSALLSLTKGLILFRERA